MKSETRRLAGPWIVALILVSMISSGRAADPLSAASPVKHIAPSSGPEARIMKIRLTINGKTTTATLADNPSARDFLTMLPLTLKLDDYASTEKIAYLPRKLSTHGAPAGIDPEIGDITYYAPWGNLALFYRDFGYSTGLIRLGRFDSDVDVLHAQGNQVVTIEAIAQ